MRTNRKNADTGSGASCSRFPRPTLPIPESAAPIHKKIVDQISHLLGSRFRCALEPGFVQGYRNLLALFDEYQKEIIRHSGYRVSCSRGCAQCCCHWVEDVYSFEGEIIADHIRRTFPKRIAEIVASFSDDVAHIERLDRRVAAKLTENRNDPEVSSIDQVDLLLSCFYQLRRPCALLLPDNRCSIYDVRPLTCRIYFNFSDPAFCDPDYINVSDIRTYLLDMEEEASALLDRLHCAFDRFDGDMGLRSVLLKHLGA